MPDSKSAVVTISAHEHCTDSPIDRSRDQPPPAGQGIAKQIRKSNGPRKRPANDERSVTSTDRSSTTETMGEGEGHTEEEIIPQLGVADTHTIRPAGDMILSVHRLKWAPCRSCPMRIDMIAITASRPVAKLSIETPSGGCRPSAPSAASDASSVPKQIHLQWKRTTSSASF